ncbi:MAG TPA: 6-bladed beta-propeller [Edaphocola sp.]|nr:6-bladed beta-propeller [Edaphocola sp.]
MIKFLYASIFTICFFAASCSKKTNNDIKEISIDFDKIESLDLSNGNEINLEFSDSSIIRRIDELRLYNKTHYFIRSGSDLLLFDDKGFFKNQIGQKGNGPMEFTHFNSFFVRKDTVFIYDAMSKRIILYDLNGKYLKYELLKDTYTDITPNYIFPIAQNKFISKNTYGGDNRKIPSYSILDENYKVISNLKNRYLKDGITSLNNFFSDNNSVLFWELLNDSLFSVTNDTTYSPKYFINFHEKSLPKSIRKLDLYDAIELTNKPDNKQKYASLIRCVYEDLNYLRFIFLYNGEVYYVKSDKNKDYVKTYKFHYNNGEIVPIIYFEDNKLVIPVSSFEDEGNPTLVIIDERLL